MSDQDVSSAFDALEVLLAGTEENPDPQAVAAWHEGFKRALATAERGPQWPALQARGRSLGTRLDQQVAILRALQESVKQEMDSQSTGRRALSAYAPSRG